MSNPSRVQGGHGPRFEQVANSATPKDAYAPKGTLKLRPMTSREGGYNPEKVVVPGFGYEHHGQFLRAGTQTAFVASERGSIAQQFYTSANRRRILESVLMTMRAKTGTQLTVDNIPAYMADNAMKRAFEVYGESSANASHATVGPSESLPWLAPESKYEVSAHNVDQRNGETLDELNALAARMMLESIVSEKALLSRYHTDLSGAIHVLEYPTRPNADMRRGHQLNFQYYDDITSAANSGISGNQLTRGTQSSKFDQSVRPGWSVPQFSRTM
jgi:hypothetical protein